MVGWVEGCCGGGWCGGHRAVLGFWLVGMTCRVGWVVRSSLSTVLVVLCVIFARFMSSEMVGSVPCWLWYLWVAVAAWLWVDVDEDGAAWCSVLVV